MGKTFVSLTAALAIVSAGALLATGAQAGGSQSAPIKVSKASYTVSARTYQGRSTGITEFSAASWRRVPPGR